MSRNEKVNAYIGFSIKAGKLLYGYESVIASRKRVHLIVCDETLAENSLKKVTRFATENNVPLCMTESLSEYFEGKSVKCIGFTEENLASAAANQLNITSEVVTDERKQ